MLDALLAGVLADAIGYRPTLGLAVTIFLAAMLIAVLSAVRQAWTSEPAES